MKLSDFKIGHEFECGNNRYLCTDIGSRTVVALRVDEVSATISTTHSTTTRRLTHKQATAEGWFNGPPYALKEQVFDEYDQAGCAGLAE